MHTSFVHSNRSIIKLIFLGAGIVGWWTVSIGDVAGQETDAALNFEVDDAQPEAEPIDIPPGAVELPADVYEHVAGRSFGISLAESPAYYAILNHAKIVPPDRLRQAACRQLEIRHQNSPLFKDKPIEKFLPFVDLFKYPDEYIGKPVTFSGYTRRVITASADPNPHGIKTLYELWLFTDDSQNNPLVLVCTQVPENMPRGDELVNGVSVTGYFFKLYGYPGGDSKRLAPMILAHRVEWNPLSAPSIPVSPWVLYPALISIVGLILFSLWYTAYRDRMNSPLKRVTLEAPERLSWPEGSTGLGNSSPSPNIVPPIIESEPGTESDERV